MLSSWVKATILLPKHPDNAVTIQVHTGFVRNNVSVRPNLGTTKMKHPEWKNKDFSLCWNSAIFKRKSHGNKSITVPKKTKVAFNVSWLVQILKIHLGLMTFFRENLPEVCKINQVMGALWSDEKRFTTISVSVFIGRIIKSALTKL